MSLIERQGSGWRRLSDWIAPDVVVAWAVAAAVYLLVALDAGGPLRVAVVAPATVLLPGYLLVAALYPHDGSAGTGSVVHARVDRIDLRERLALSFGLGLATLPLLGVAIGLSPWAFSEATAVGAFVGFVAVVGVVAAIRRRRLAPQDRFHVPVGRWLAEARSAVATGPATDRTLNVVVLVAALLALGTVGYALAVPPAGQGYEDFAVLTEDGDELVAGGYPEAISADEPASLVTVVENEHDRAQRYTVVVTLERPAAADGGTAGETVELQRYQETVEPGERWTHRHEVVPELSGEDLRLNYYLYRGEAPSSPDPSEAEHHLYVWTSAGGDGAA